MEEMGLFYDKCLEELYPPGSCGVFCNQVRPPPSSRTPLQSVPWHLRRTCHVPMYLTRRLVQHTYECFLKEVRSNPV